MVDKSEERDDAQNFHFRTLEHLRKPCIQLLQINMTHQGPLQTIEAHPKPQYT